MDWDVIARLWLRLRLRSTEDEVDEKRLAREVVVARNAVDRVLRWRSCRAERVKGIEAIRLRPAIFAGESQGGWEGATGETWLKMRGCGF